MIRVLKFVIVSWITIYFSTECNGQKINHITQIPNFDLDYGKMVYDDGNVFFIGDIVDTTGYWGYHIGRLDTAGQMACFKYYIDSLRVKQLVFGPSLKIDENRYLAMGCAWKKSRPMLVVFNDKCDTILTKEYSVEPDDSLYFQVMQDLIPIEGIGYVIVGTLITYSSMVNLRSQIFAMLIDTNFQTIWQAQYGGSQSDLGICADVLSADTLLIFGIENIGLYAWPTKPTSRFMHLLKISLQDGSLLWEKNDIAPNRSSTFDFVRSPDQGYILCAAELVDSLYANGLPTNYYPKNSVFHFNSNFEITWEKTYGQKSITYGTRNTDITESIDHDGVVVVGTVIDFSDSLGYKTMVSKLSWSGDSIWTRYYQPVHHNPPVNYFALNSLEDQILPTENGYILQTDLFLYPGDTSFPYNEQIWFLELDSYGCHIPGCHLISATEDPLPSESDSIAIVLYPNPVNEVLAVQLIGAYHQATTLSVFDAAGRLMLSTSISREDTQYLFPVRHWPPGTYTLVVSNGNSPLASKQFIRME